MVGEGDKKLNFKGKSLLPVVSHMFIMGTPDAYIFKMTAQKKRLRMNSNLNMWSTECVHTAVNYVKSARMEWAP